MFSSNETQNSPGETSTLPKGEPTVSQTTVETTTTNNSNSATITTNPDNNGNNNGGGGKDRISIHFNHLKKLLEQMKSYLTVLKTPSENSPKSNNLQTSSGSNGRRSAVGELVNVQEGEFFSSCSFFREIQEFFYGLDRKSQFLLSCFTVFPENAVVKRRIFVYWGLGEEELRDAEAKSPEKIVDKILEEFQEKGLIEPVIKKRKQPQHVKSYRMDPLVRSAATLLPKEAKFFDYDGKGNVLPQRDWTSGLDSKGNPRTVSDQDLENAITLFNVNEPFPDLELARLIKMKDKNVAQKKEPSAVDWLSKMKSAKVVCLGSWPGSAKSHIEVQSREFLRGLTNMKGPESLSFLSLQGISRIKELPRSIGLLRSLLILDLKECHNLEILSEEIANLTNLRYLDVSDCYLLADMPKGLGVHSELRVLKGFVISNRQKIRRSGTLHDLKRLRNLRKLTINARSKDFPTRNDLSALQELGGVLRNLTIVWGPTEPNKAPKPEAKIVEETKSAGTVPIVEIETLPRQLKKLDLQCFPKSTATWLTPESLPNLEKLYVRGNLATLGESKWSQVKTLRLKYLNELKTTWIKLQQSFPKLEYLEKVKCPGIILCPCDEHGVWMKTI
uniref:Disease resistance R13L4/SHOC-2-like LRR domain-containing protein n=1 Tax=Quercus lobata TaxID=97700 RepID=A0A7N2N2L6_QUELO